MPINKIMVEGVRIPSLNFGSALFLHVNEDEIEKDMPEAIEKYKDMHPMQGPVCMWRRNGRQGDFAKLFTAWGDELFCGQVMINVYPWFKDEQCKFGCVSEICIQRIRSVPSNMNFDHSSIRISNKISRCWFERGDTLFPSRVPHNLWWNPFSLGGLDDPNPGTDERYLNVYERKIWFF